MPVPQHLVIARFFDVEDLALEREDGLEAPVSPLLGRAACRFALHQEQLAAFGLAFRAVGQLAGQSAAVERTFAARQVASFARSFASAGSVDRFVDDLARDRRVLLKERSQ